MLLGNGDGTFQQPVPYATDNASSSIVVADLDGNGKLDVVAADLTGAPGHVVVMLGNGDGSLRAPARYQAGVGSPQSRSLAVGDLNHDGKPDLVLSSINSDNVSVLLGNGDGTFRAQTVFDTGNFSQPTSVAIADIDGDGKLDLAVAGPSTAGVLLGNGDGTFQKATRYPAASSATPIAIVDVNGDSRADLVFAAPSANVMYTGDLNVLFGDPESGFLPQVTLAADPSVPASLATADLDGDHRPDVAITSGSSVSVFLNRCSGR